MIHIKLSERTGSFAENKDLAKELRENVMLPALERKEEVVLDFENVEAATQSFIHALISDLMRKYGNDVLDQIKFKSCNEKLKKIISIVIDYMQESA